MAEYDPNNPGAVSGSDDLTRFLDEDFGTDEVDLFEFTSGEEESPLTQLKTIILGLDWNPALQNLVKLSVLTKRTYRQVSCQFLDYPPHKQTTYRSLPLQEGYTVYITITSLVVGPTFPLCLVPHLLTDSCGMYQYHDYGSLLYGYVVNSTCYYHL